MHILQTSADVDGSYQFPARHWKRLLFLIVFLMITPIALGTTLFSLVTLADSGEVKGVAASQPNLIESPKPGVQVFAALPSEIPSISGQVIPSDARSEMVRQYLARYNSPLEPQSYFLVETADKYGLDYRLLVAIAQQESNLCKIIPPESYNCWGWGIHSRGTLGFESYEEGIETVARGLKENYIDLGYKTPDEIMTKYTPLSNGSWAKGVNLFMGQME